MHWPWKRTPAWAVDLTRQNVQILAQGNKLMSVLTDLQTAVAKLAADTAAEIKAVADKLASLPAGSVSDADVEAAVASLNATAATLEAETASLTPPPAV
jgi:hypothetical protein